MTALFDTHTHIASDDAARYPRRLGGFGSDWWGTAGHEAGDLVADLDRADVDLAVAVQAVGVYGYDNRYVLDAVRAHPTRLRAVVGVDMADDPLKTINAMGSDAAVVGVRLFAVGGDDSWIGQPIVHRVLDACAASRLTVVLTVFSHHLGPLRESIAAHPRVDFALDHCAFPDLSSGLVAPDAPLVDYATLPNVALKVSSHLLLHLAEHGDPAGFVADLAARFDGSRLLWGSDYPQSASGYCELVALAHRSADELMADDRDAYLGGNARRLFAPRR